MGHHSTPRSVTHIAPEPWLSRLSRLSRPVEACRGLSRGCRGAVELDSLTAAVEAVELSRAVEGDATFRTCRGCRVLSSCRAVELSRVCQGCRGLTLEWLHLMRWLYLWSIHQGRCPLTSVAIKGVHIGSSMAWTVIRASEDRKIDKKQALHFASS